MGDKFEMGQVLIRVENPDFTATFDWFRRDEFDIIIVKEMCHDPSYYSCLSISGERVGLTDEQIDKWYKVKI